MIIKKDNDFEKRGDMIMAKEFEIGQIVTGTYKTGKYVGKIIEQRGDRYLFEVLAVLKHPKQGDLHHPNSADVPLFHERRALAYKEKTNMPRVYIREYNEEIPDYNESLKKALYEEIEALQNDDSEFAKKSLQNLKNLEKSYFQ